MIRLASAAQLGLYAVAVTLATAPGMVVGTLAGAIFPRVAAGETHLVARSCRISLLATVVCGVGVAVLAYPVLTLLFGPGFQAATTMVVILLVAQIPSSANVVLGFSLRSAGMPGKVSIAELIGLSVTIPGVFALVPVLGGIGAAIVSTAAYGAIFIYLLWQGRRIFGGNVRDYLCIQRDDISELGRQLEAQLRRIRPASDVAAG